MNADGLDRAENSFRTFMFDLILVLIACGLILAIFTLWQAKQRHFLIGSNSPTTTTTSNDRCRQSQRYLRCCLFGLGSSNVETSFSSFQSFVDRFKSLTDVAKGMKSSGFDVCDLILGVDFTASNEWQGRRTFNHHCLHAILLRGLNPYQQVIKILGSTLEPFSEDGCVYAYGFGDQTTRNRNVFSFSNDPILPLAGFHDVLKRYTTLAKSVVLAGPTCFAPILNKSIELVRQRNRYHILIIISDGQMTDEDETMRSIIEASSYPLSIIMVGVGDGPWDTMEEFDDFLPRRKFDNFQFVDFHKAVENKRNAEATFALRALMEIPDQYKAIRDLGLI